MSELYECADCGHKALPDSLPDAENLLSRLSVGDTFTDKECSECGALCFPEEPVTENKPALTLWENDRVQFARLIQEIQMAGGLTSKVTKALRDSMDLTRSELVSLFDRARRIFEATKAVLKVPPGGDVNVEVVDIGGEQITIQVEPGVLILDFSKNGQAQEGGRIWLTRGQTDAEEQGWRLLLHPDDADPTHCVFMADDKPEITVFGKDEEETHWPGGC